MSFSAPDKRCQKIALAPREPVHYEVHYLGIVVAHHLKAGFRGNGPGALGIEKPQEVVDFRYGTNRGTGVVSSGLLLYGNDGTEAVYFLNLRLFQYAHEVLGIGGKGVHIPALTLRIKRIKRQ